MATLQVTSTAFAPGEMIPSRYSCDGDNISPQLSWENVPEKTESLAILCVDPDAHNFTHWLLYNLPRGTTSILQDVHKDEVIQDNARQGMNSALYLINYNQPGKFVTFEPLGPGGDPYPAMYGKPDAAKLDALVNQSIRYFREREEAVLAE